MTGRNDDDLWSIQEMSPQRKMVPSGEHQTMLFLGQASLK